MTAEQIQQTLESVNNVLLQSAESLEKYAGQLRHAATGYVLSIPSHTWIRTVADKVENAEQVYWDLYKQAREEKVDQV